MLRFNRYRFQFTAIDEIRLPEYPGSALRGIFGHGLLRTVCVTNHETCAPCALKRQCAYTALFETQLFSPKKSQALQPMVFTLDQYETVCPPDSKLGLELTLVGKANRYLPYLIPAWQRAGQRGFGKEKARFELSNVTCWDADTSQWQPLWPEPKNAMNYAVDPGYHKNQIQTIDGDLEVTLVTPYRSKRDKQLIGPKNFEVQGFVASLIRRIESLRSQHDEKSPQMPIKSLYDAVATLEMVDSTLEWSEVKRHSSRQKTHMNMGGVKGRFILRGEGLNTLLPLLEIGQWLHAGKNTLFGLGHYRIKPVA